MRKVNLIKLIEKAQKSWQVLDVITIDKTALRIVKIDGSYRWHSHRNEDEFFLVLQGKIFIDIENEVSIELNEMEGFKVKKGTRHRSRSGEPAWVLVVEPVETKTLGE